ncbi:MAG: septal ring lytic transglycosylase RlpA family protein [Flavitalea sp.]
MKWILLGVILLIQGLEGVHAQSRADSIRKANNKKVPVIQTGTASYYHAKFQGRLTASGEKYDQLKMTAAHNRLPMNTWIKVTNLRNKRSVIVRVNDRLNFRNKRLVDLSRSAAAKLGYVGRGLARVKVEVLKNYHGESKK